MENRVDCWRIHHLGAKVAKLHSLDERELIDDIRRRNHARVGSHKAVDIGPNFKRTSIERRSNQRRSVVAAATTQVGDFARVAVRRNEARHQRHIALKRAERLLHKLLGELKVS